MALTRVEYDFKCRVTKTIEVGVSGAQNPTSKAETATLGTGTLTPNSSPAAQLEWLSSRTITSTSEQLNLAALTYGNLPTVDFTTGSYRVQMCKIVASTNNTTDVTIAPSTANGYTLFNTTTAVNIPIGGMLMWYTNGKTPLVTSSARLLSVTATTSGQAYDIQLVAG